MIDHLLGNDSQNTWLYSHGSLEEFFKGVAKTNFFVFKGEGHSMVIGQVQRVAKLALIFLSPWCKREMYAVVPKHVKYY